MTTHMASDRNHTKRSPPPARLAGGPHALRHGRNKLRAASLPTEGGCTQDSLGRSRTSNSVQPKSIHLRAHGEEGRVTQDTDGAGTYFEAEGRRRARTSLRRGASSQGEPTLQHVPCYIFPALHTRCTQGVKCAA